MRKTAGSKDISDFVATNAVVRVQGLKGKPQRTSKKASGKRQKTIAWKNASLLSSSKQQRKKQSKKENAARDKHRRPKSMKTCESRAGITFKASRSAYNSLLKTQWVWKEKQCACGQVFDTVPWKTCMRRGFGRLFLRCYSCGCSSAFFFTCKFLVSCKKLTCSKKRYAGSHLVHDWNDANQVGMMSFISVHYPRFACPSSTSGSLSVCGLQTSSRHQLILWPPSSVCLDR